LLSEAAQAQAKFVAAAACGWTLTRAVLDWRLKAHEYINQAERVRRRDSDPYVS
jgi:hypothetical protein